MIRLAINGVLGRMGQRLLALARDDPRFLIVAALEHPEHPALGAPVGPAPEAAPGGTRRGGPDGGDDVVKLTADLPDTPIDVCLDFTRPASAVARAQSCAVRGVAFVTGTTGLNGAQAADLRAAAARVPVLHAGNFSQGIAVLAALVAEAARRLGPEFDLEILEFHHRHKVDAPSGTALLLGEAAAGARGAAFFEVARHGREGHTGERPSGEIGIHALRGGDVVGEHAVILAGPGERLELRHQATTRDIFARGALSAAAWIAGRTPGWYRFPEVLGLPAELSK